MDSPRPPTPRRAAGQLVVLSQTAPSPISGGTAFQRRTGNGTDAPVSCQALRSDAVLQENQACQALISEAQDRQQRHAGLHTDARPATTHTYVYVHKTEDGGSRHTFCYCLGTNQWADVGTDLVEAAGVFPDPPGCCFTSYAEKVKSGTRGESGSGS